jgi:predicted regulator of Ras-like GTPase activity (Roadblock/LC7/MglB family)
MEKELGLILKRLSKRIQSVVVVDKTGLPIMSFSPEARKPIDREMEMMIAGIAAAVLTLSEKTSTVLDQGAFKQVMIENERGSTVILDAGNAIIIAVLATKLGFNTTLISLKHAAKEIATLKLSSTAAPAKSAEPADIFVPEID